MKQIGDWVIHSRNAIISEVNRNDILKPDKFDRSAGRVVDVIGFPPTARKVKDGNVAIADQFMVPTSLLSSISLDSERERVNVRNEYTSKKLQILVWDQ